MDNINNVQNAFVQDAGLTQVLNMYNVIPDVLFWVKDLQHRFIFANHAFLEKHGVSDIKYLVEKNELDLTFQHFSEKSMLDDNKVLQGETSVERMTINGNRQDESRWYLSTKRPIYNQKKEIIGLYGIARYVQHSANVDVMLIPVEYMKEHYQKNISIEDLAEMVHLSVSAFERRFKKLMNKTPWQLLLEIRVENAKRLLRESSLTIAEVGLACGFTDNCYFSKQFKKYCHLSPSHYRRLNLAVIV